MSPLRAPHTRHQVLLVDDDAGILSMLHSILSKDGLEVASASSVTAALTMLEHELPCMILADVTMPGIDGFELCRRLKRDPRTAHLPVALVTGRINEADVGEGLAAGAVDYIKKPFDRDELRMRVRTQIRLHETLLEQRQLHQQLSMINEATNDAIIISDSLGRITHWNRAAETIFGYSCGEALGERLHELIAPPRFREAQARALPGFLATGRGAALGTTTEFVALRKSGEEFPIELSLASARVEGSLFAVGIVRDITERKRMETALRQDEEDFRALYESSRDALYNIKPPSWRYTTCNRAALTLFRAASVAQFEQLHAGGLSAERQPDGRVSAEAIRELLDQALREGSVRFDWLCRKLDGEEFFANVLFNRVAHRGEAFIQATVRDLTERRMLEAELGHARKLEAVGQLAAGIAHEINTPIQYVGDSIHFLKEAFRGFQTLHAGYRRAVEALAAADGKELAEEIRELEETLDVGFLEKRVPESLGRASEGVSRISTIVKAMKEFAHPDKREKQPADLNHALQGTLIIARSEYKHIAEVETAFSELPPVQCHLGDLNQVFLNLVVNAAHAIGERVGESGDKGLIRIATGCEDGSVRIEISDTGAGIPDAIRHHIFEPFFTTKEVGKGTGQGLAIARSIVVGKHGGTLGFESVPGQGTTFTIRLPVDGAGAAERSAGR